MKVTLSRLASTFHLLLDDKGQDLIEYALVVALIGFGATAGMKKVATGVNNAFGGIGTTLTSYIS